jgi:hypothetical protein
MTKHDAEMVVSIEQTKLFLLRDVPFAELPESKRMTDIVKRYRNGSLQEIEAIQYFESFHEELQQMVTINNFYKNMITESEQ